MLLLNTIEGATEVPFGKDAMPETFRLVVVALVVVPLVATKLSITLGKATVEEA